MISLGMQYSYKYVSKCTITLGELHMRQRVQLVKKCISGNIENTLSLFF